MISGMAQLLQSWALNNYDHLQKVGKRSTRSERHCVVEDEKALGTTTIAKVLYVVNVPGRRIDVSSLVKPLVGYWSSCK